MGTEIGLEIEGVFRRDITLVLRKQTFKKANQLWKAGLGFGLELPLG